jgi:cytochrome c2
MNHVEGRIQLALRRSFMPRVTCALSYSAGMKKLGEQGFVWTEENMDKWIADPKAMIPDSPMALAFQGIPDAA